MSNSCQSPMRQDSAYPSAVSSSPPYLAAENRDMGSAAYPRDDLQDTGPPIYVLAGRCIHLEIHIACERKLQLWNGNTTSDS